MLKKIDKILNYVLVICGVVVVMMLYTNYKLDKQTEKYTNDFNDYVEEVNEHLEDEGSNIRLYSEE